MKLIPTFRLLLLAALACPSTGCFVEKYEARLQQTVTLFRHDQTLNENLDNVWAANGVSLRVPVPYALIPPPAPEPAEKPDAPRRFNPRAVDKRQPTYLKMELPGLLGAWECKVRAPAGDVPSYIYVLGNQFLLAGGTGPNRLAPDKFQADLLKRLTETLGLKLSEKDWRTEEFPRESLVADYLPRVSYQSTVLEPPNPVAGRRLRFRVYTTNKQDVQLVIIFVVPADVDNANRLYQQFDMCLETLQVDPGSYAARSAAPAAAGGSPNAPKAAPAAPPPGGGF
ncbi:MAG: hypothetical protein U0903_12585 [Planctomycetales bacterium]